MAAVDTARPRTRCGKTSETSSHARGPKPTWYPETHEGKDGDERPPLRQDEVGERAVPHAGIAELLEEEGHCHDGVRVDRDSDPQEEERASTELVHARDGEYPEDGGCEAEHSRLARELLQAHYTPADHQRLGIVGAIADADCNRPLAPPSLDAHRVEIASKRIRPRWSIVSPQHSVAQHGVL